MACPTELSALSDEELRAPRNETADHPLVVAARGLDSPAPMEIRQSLQVSVLGEQEIGAGAGT